MIVAALTPDTPFTLPVEDVLIGSIIMPPLIAVLNQRQWSAQAKGLVALGACFVAAFIATLLRGPVTFGEWRATALAVCVSAFGAYKLWWQPSQVAPAIEAATTLRVGRRMPAPPPT